MTGWIPERIALKETDVDKFFKMISSRYNAGEVLVTFSTGDISDYESERTGLVSTHAYAMLDIQNVQVKKFTA